VLLSGSLQVGNFFAIHISDFVLYRTLPLFLSCIGTTFITEIVIKKILINEYCLFKENTSYQILTSSNIDTSSKNTQKPA